MTHLSSFARSIPRILSQRRAYLLVLLTVIALLFAQPLLVRAKPTSRAHSQLAGLAQVTPSTTDEPEEEDSTDNDDDNETPTATAEAQAEDQQNADGEDVAASNVISIEIPAENIQADGAIALPFDWQGEATISASDLADVAPPLKAEVSQGDFQIAYLTSETGNSLRILPVASAGELSSLRIGLSLDQNSTNPPLPVGQTLLLQASARVYAPDATTRLVIADENGSSSVAVDGLNWNDYQVARAIAEDATMLEIVLEWSNVPANGWLELRGLSVVPVPSSDAIALSPTDIPQVIEAVALSPTVPPQTPTPTATSNAMATPLPTATPLPESVSGQGASSAPISDTVILTPTATFIVVTSTPPPKDVFEEATRVAQATDWARILGPATATPPNVATATPTITPIVLVNTPTPANEATAIQVAILATAVAFTTGTPTPIPPNATVLIATATDVPPTATPRATNTPTPVFVLLDDIPIAEPTVTPVVPEILYNKIIFLSSYRGNPNQPNAMVMNPDGTGVGLLTTNYFYNIAATQDTFSADSRFRVYSLRESGGAAHNAGLIQLFYDDTLYNSTQHQLTYFGAGVAWAPAWSPRSETIAFVSSESGNDEIWVTNTNQWPATQLTDNAWEWDHHPSFSPDGSQIVFSSNRVTGRRQLWIMSASGGDQAQLTNFTFEAWNPVWVKYVTPDAAVAQP